MTSSADFNRQIIEEFHANQGRVGGIFQDALILPLHHTGATSEPSRRAMKYRLGISVGLRPRAPI